MNIAEIHISERQFYTQYAQEYRERFESGYLAELLPYPHFVVWRAETIDGQPKKPPYNPNRPGSRADVSTESGSRLAEENCFRIGLRIRKWPSYAST